MFHVVYSRSYYDREHEGGHFESVFTLYRNCDYSQLGTFGKSMLEKNAGETVGKILRMFKDNSCKLYLPEDCSVAKSKEGTKIEVKIGAQIERGYFYDLDAGGNMIVRDNEYRTKTISAGEVHFLDKNM